MIFYNGFNLLVDLVLVGVAVWVTYSLTKRGRAKLPFSRIPLAESFLSFHSAGGMRGGPDQSAPLFTIELRNAANSPQKCQTPMLMYKYVR